MPQSLAQVLIHIVFSTKDRAAWLQDKAIRQSLYAYMATTLQNIDSPALLINGVEDHIHILCALSRKISIAALVEEAKTETSKWIKKLDNVYDGFHWQSGYGAFSVSSSNKGQVMTYIRNQESHHRTMSYQEELRELLRRYGLAWDERYVWD